MMKVYEELAALAMPTRFIGVAMNSRLLKEDEVEVERERVRRELGLPVCDVFRHGPGELVDAALGAAGAARSGDRAGVVRSLD